MIYRHGTIYPFVISKQMMMMRMNLFWGIFAMMIHVQKQQRFPFSPSSSCCCCCPLSSSGCCCCCSCRWFCWCSCCPGCRLRRNFVFVTVSCRYRTLTAPPVKGNLSSSSSSSSFSPPVVPWLLLAVHRPQVPTWRPPAPQRPQGGFLLSTRISFVLVRWTGICLDALPTFQIIVDRRWYVHHRWGR